MYLNYAERKIFHDAVLSLYLKILKIKKTPLPKFSDENITINPVDLHHSLCF